MDLADWNPICSPSFVWLKWQLQVADFHRGFNSLKPTTSNPPTNFYSRFLFALPLSHPFVRVRSYFPRFGPE